MNGLVDDDFFSTPEVPTSWATPSFTCIFEAISTNGKKIKQRDYKASGAIPVVDQGEMFVGGYTDDEDAVIEAEGPLIVFGDHTRVFKFLRTRFAPGADGTKVLKPSGALDPKFAYFACKATRLPDKGYSRHFSLLKKTKVPVAPLNEQRRIVEKIETLFARLDKGEQALRAVQTLLARYRQSVLKAAVTGQLTADWRAENAHRLEHGRDLLARILKTRRETWQGHGKYKEPSAPDTMSLPALPDGWAWASVEQLANVMGGLTKNKKRQDMPLRKPMLRVANVYQGRLDLDDIHQTGVTETECNRVFLEDRDLLVVEGNGSRDQIGRMAIWRNEIPGAVHQNHLIKVRMIEKRLVDFALSWFQSPNGRQNIEKVASSTSGLYTLSISKIEALIVPIPSLLEIAETSQLVDDAFSTIAYLENCCEAELARSAALRQSILKDAFAGRLVPQDPADEPAAELLARIRETRVAAPRNRRTTAITIGRIPDE